MVNLPPKPVSEVWRPHLTRLPERHGRRRAVRRILRWAARLVVGLAFEVTVHGLEHYPRQGPALLVANHLGDADAVVGLAFFPVLPEVFAKAELVDLFPWGQLMEAYGVIWVHRGRPDRRALRAGLQALAEGRLLAIAPEGRQSVTGALEPGTEGVAYLALKADVPVVPIALTGTRNAQVYGALKRLRRPRVTLTVGAPFRLQPPVHLSWRQALTWGTERIMCALARLLPPEYRGVYASCVESAPASGEPHGA